MRRPDEYEVFEYSTGNATARSIFYAIQTIDKYGTTYDDPEAEWEITNFEASLTLAGTFKLVAVDSSGTATDLISAIPIAAGGGIDLPSKIIAGKMMDVAYTTTGGGDTQVRVIARSRRYTLARPAMTEVP